MDSMENAKPKRRFWQLHLSTAILMILVASLFIFVQTRGYEGRIVVDLSKENSNSYALLGGKMAWDPGTSYGWPFCFVHVGHYKTQLLLLPALIELDSFILTIALPTIVCEYLIRRREARRP
jgi:hypothetical protein